MVVAGGGAWRAQHRGVFDAQTGAAFQPWADWRSAPDGGPAALVAAAVLASNAHNAQPWLFRVGPSRIEVLADARRELGTIDPFSRELHIGLGCALENLVLAAGAHGYRHRLRLTPDPSDPAHVATVALSPGPAEPSPLYEAIPDRRTNRYPYDTSRSVPGADLDRLEALNEDPGIRVFWFADADERRACSQLLVRAAEAINADPAQSFDNGPRWMRQDTAAVARHRDGLTLDTLGLSGAALAAAKMLPTPSAESSGAAWLGLLRGQVDSAGAFGVLAVRDDRDCAARVRVGRLWQRMHLWTVVHGLAGQPMNQVHERVEREAQLGAEPVFDGLLTDLVGAPGWRGCFTFRLGQPTVVPAPSPRRSVSEVLG